jgi:SAM-dependent methyltransferase
VARTKFRPNEEVEFRPADACALPFSEGAFDTVVCQFGVMFFPQKDTSYREVRRVLAPGGRYLFSVWDSHRHNPFGRITHEIAASFFPTDHQIDPIKESLIAAGFTDINVAVVRLEKEIPDAARFARGLIHGNPLIDQIRRAAGSILIESSMPWLKLCVKNSAPILGECLSKQSYFRPARARV